MFQLSRAGQPLAPAAAAAAGPLLGFLSLQKHPAGAPVEYLRLFGEDRRTQLLVLESPRLTRQRADGCRVYRDVEDALDIHRRWN